MDLITVSVILSLLVVYISIACIILYKLLSKRSMTSLPLLILLYVYGLIIGVALPISYLYDKLYHSHIYPFVDWLIYVYGR